MLKRLLKKIYNYLYDDDNEDPIDDSPIVEFREEITDDPDIVELVDWDSQIIPFIDQHKEKLKKKEEEERLKVVLQIYEEAHRKLGIEHGHRLYNRR